MVTAGPGSSESYKTREASVRSCALYRMFFSVVFSSSQRGPASPVARLDSVVQFERLVRRRRAPEDA